MALANASIRPNSILAGDAIRAFHKRAKEAATEPDPAPWFYVPPGLIDMFAEGDEAEFVRRKKLDNRTARYMLRGLLTGSLKAHFSDENESHNIPGWAWRGRETDESIWFESRLQLSVFLPEEWQRWSCHRVFFDQSELAAWMDGLDLAAIEGLAELPDPSDISELPEPETLRLPPERTFVNLSEALSWIAFRFSLNCDGLLRAMGDPALNIADPQAKLADAMEHLADYGCGGHIRLLGKYLESHDVDEKKVLTAEIDPIRLLDFAQFDSLHDGLHHGTGLTWINSAGGVIDRAFGSGRRDSYRSVKVDREGLLAAFPLLNSYDWPSDGGSEITRLGSFEGSGIRPDLAIYAGGVQYVCDDDPPSTQVRSTGSAEAECHVWLEGEFAADPDKRRSKAKFCEAALEKFNGRLSARGFNLRVWPNLAQVHERDRVGRKKKS